MTVPVKGMSSNRPISKAKIPDALRNKDETHDGGEEKATSICEGHDGVTRLNSFSPSSPKDDLHPNDGNKAGICTREEAGAAASSAAAVARQQQGHLGQQQQTTHGSQQNAADAAAQQRVQPIRMFQVTPCVQSLEMTELAKRPIYIKLENCQATGSFKDRGIGHCIKQAYLRGHRRVVAVSAGNAGLAAAHAATTLGMPVTVVVPSTTLNLLVSRLKREGADVMVHGDTLKQSATFGTEMAAANNAFLAHPYDHPDIWEGHSTLVEELKDQLPARPAAVVVAVGGGGLMTGVLLGLEKVGWADDVAVVGVETEGTATFNASMKAGKIVGLPEDAMKSIARSIAVQKPTVSLEKYLKSPMVHSQVVSDAQSVHAVVRFADDHRFLVEPSAGAALALVYSGLVNNLSKAGALPGPPDAPIVIVICGGNSVTLDLVEEWRRKYLTTK